MYSLEQRKRAIKLYIKYGLKAAPVIRELGYPDRHLLKKWHEDYISHNNKIIITCKRRTRYTDQQRRQAVHFYLTHGKNISYTVRTLGYPCRSILSDWICEDVKEHYPSFLKGKKLVQYTQEEKQLAALEVAIRNDSVKKISKMTKASSTSLYNWNKKYVSDELNAQIQEDKLEANTEITSLKEEIQRLQKDIYQLRMEKDILEKAAELLKKDETIVLSFLSLILALTINNELLSILSILILYRNLSLLTSLMTYDMNIRILRITTSFNVIIFLVCLMLSLFVGLDLIKINAGNEKLLAMSIISCFILFSGIIFPKLPFTKHTGLRLPWTIQDEDTWNLAH